MHGERLCPLGCPMALWAAHLQAQVFRVSVSMGKQLLVPLGGCYRVSRGCFGVEGGKAGGGLALAWPQGSKRKRGGTHK